jgi:hypothetical protein
MIHNKMVRSQNSTCYNGCVTKRYGLHHGTCQKTVQLQNGTCNKKVHITHGMCYKVEHHKTVHVSKRFIFHTVL